jgi:hypothetical protein
MNVYLTLFDEILGQIWYPSFSSEAGGLPVLQSAVSQFKDWK